MDTAWLYAVVSSDKQVETLADQEAWARSISQANGWELQRVVSGVKSGKRGVRKLLADLIAELRSTPAELRPARVLMLRLDRFGRGRIVDSQVAFRDLTELGIIVHTRDGGDERLDGPMDELIAAAKFAVAAFENAVRQEKSLAYHKRKREAGEHGGGVPYGFVLVDKRLAPYEPEAAIIRALFEKRLAGWGYQRLALYAVSIAPAKIRPNGAFRKIGWSTSTVRTALANRSYRGSLVTESLWDAVATMRRGILDRPARRWSWPLKGAIRCTCGALLNGEASGREGYRTRYYVCRRITAEEHRGKWPHHNAQRMEAQFVDRLGKLSASPELAATYEPKAPPIEKLETRRESLVRERTAVDRRRQKVWDSYLDDLLEKTELAAQLERLRAETDRLDAAIVDLDRQIGALINRERIMAGAREALRGAAGAWHKMDVRSQQAVAKALAAYVGGLYADPSKPHLLFLVESKRVDTFLRSMGTGLLALEVALREALTCR